MRIRRDSWPARIDFVTGPDAGKVGFAIRQPRRGGRYIHIAIGFPWRSRRGIAHPLSGQGCAQNDKGHSDKRFTTSKKQMPHCAKNTPMHER